MNCIIYTRVSTDEQVNNYSLVNQEKTCREYCEKQGWKVVAVFIEEGESAKTANRSKLIELLNFCSNKKDLVDVVLVYKFDRLARNVNDHTAIRAQLISKQILLRSATEAVDDSPGGKFMENMMAAVAQFDNEVRGQRAKSGMMEKVRDGYWAWPAPFGYANRDGEIVPVPEQAELIKAGFEYFADTPFTVKQITLKLNAMGLRSRKGRKLLPQDISKMLRNKVYIGVIDCSDTWGFVVEEAQHQPIIPKELFYRVQHRLERGKKPNDKRIRMNPKFPLKNIMRCPKCGKNMTGSSPKGRSKSYPYYHCTTCRSPNQRKEEVENAFYTNLKNIQANKRMNDLFIEVLKDAWRDKHADSSAVLKSIDADIRQLQELKDKLIDRAVLGVIKNEDYKRRMDKLDIELIAKETERSDYKETANDATYYINLAETLVNNVATLWAEVPFEYQQRFQEMIFPKGIVYQDGAIGTAEIGFPFNLIPTSAEPKDLLVSREGVEPPTNALRGHCSTIELPAHARDASKLAGT